MDLGTGAGLAVWGYVGHRAGTLAQSTIDGRARLIGRRHATHPLAMACAPHHVAAGRGRDRPRRGAAAGRAGPGDRPELRSVGRTVTLIGCLWPALLIGLLPGVRELEVTAARTLLGVTAELI